MSLCSDCSSGSSREETTRIEAGNGKIETNSPVARLAALERGERTECSEVRRRDGGIGCWRTTVTASLQSCEQRTTAASAVVSSCLHFPTLFPSLARSSSSASPPTNVHRSLLIRTSAWTIPQVLGLTIHSCRTNCSRSTRRHTPRCGSTIPTPRPPPRPRNATQDSTLVRLPSGVSSQQ